MEAANTDNADQWFDSTLTVLTDAYQLDLHRLMSPDTYELAQALSDFYMYDTSGLFIHLIGLTSHYLTSTSFVYADNQLKHRLHLHLLLVVRAGRERMASDGALGDLLTEGVRVRNAGNAARQMKRLVTLDSNNNKKNAPLEFLQVTNDTRWSNISDKP